MENSSKALYIAGSVLMAVIVVSFLIYSFNNMGILQKAQDTIEYEEEISEFNLQYEAFDKKLMYGVDVISCINKAVSNNEKYVKDGKWSIAGASGEEALVQITVNLNKKLEESMQVFGLNSKDKESKIYNDHSGKIKDSLSKDKRTIKEFFKISNPDKILTSFDLQDDYIMNLTQLYNDFSLTKKLENKTPKTTMQLLDYQDGKKSKVSFVDNEYSLYMLTYYSDNQQFVAYNEKIENDDGTYDHDTWYCIKWTTVLGDFKKRKFTCEKINYNKSTGRVDELIFTEK